MNGRLEARGYGQGMAVWILILMPRASCLVPDLL